MKFNALSVLLLSVMLPLANASDDSTEGWTILFDGKNTDQWQDYKGGPVGKAWKIEDGTLTMAEKGGGNVATKEMYSDFDFRFEWKISPGGNSGIIFLSRKGDGAPYMSGPEYQILDDSKHRDGGNPKTSAGSLYALIAAQGKTLKPVGDWNTGRIVKDGDNLQHWVNGKKVVETTIGDDKWNAMVAGSKFKNWEQFGKTKKGHIVLQDHNDQVWYRNLKIKDLSK